MEVNRPKQKPIKRRPRRASSRLKTRAALVLALVSLLALSARLTAAIDQKQGEESNSAAAARAEAELSKTMPANHRMGPEGQPAENLTVDRSRLGARHGRQYDASISASGSGTYGAVSGDAGAYVNPGLSPLIGGYSSATANGVASAGYGSVDSMGAGLNSYPAASYHDQLSLARGYPMHHSAAAYSPPPPPPPPMQPFGSALASMFPSSVGSSGFPLMSKGFDIAEIVCTAIAVAIGAVIVGAPFILVYLFVMNQMQGSGPNALGPGGGSINLTGPTASTNVGGRKKRQTTFAEALFRQLGPLVNNEQLEQAFKVLMNSIAKYQV